MKIAVASAALFLLAGCGGGASGAPESSSEPVPLRLGHFPNLTHAPAIYGLEEGLLTDALGDEVTLDVKQFNAGPEVVQAIFSGDLDASYIGPNPAINAFQRSKGEAVRIIAGATSGGAALVTKPSITSPEQIKGKKIATPQLGNTQDVALRAWLSERGLESDQQGGGDVSIVNQENAQTLETFRAGQIDGAWVPEPWSTRLQLEGGGKVLRDEKTLWPRGKYATTLLVVRTEFLEEHPDVVERLLKGHVETLDQLASDPAESQRVVNAGIEKLTDKPLKEEVLEAAWRNLEFTYDPLISTIEQSAAAARNVGLLDDADVNGIADLELLNKVLRAGGKEEVSS
jgi:NitT/TauT family transport system substrate-binding protein